MQAQKDRKFFTFCFIPVVPVSFAKNLTCSICGYRQSTNEDQLKQLQQQQQQQQYYQQGGAAAAGQHFHNQNYSNNGGKTGYQNYGNPPPRYA